MTVRTTETGHGHVHVVDLAIAVIVVEVITEARGAPAEVCIANWSGEWHCRRCGAWRFEPDTDTT